MHFFLSFLQLSDNLIHRFEISFSILILLFHLLSLKLYVFPLIIQLCDHFFSIFLLASHFVNDLSQDEDTRNSKNVADAISYCTECEETGQTCLVSRRELFELQVNTCTCSHLYHCHKEKGTKIRHIFVHHFFCL